MADDTSRDAGPKGGPGKPQTPRIEPDRPTPNRDKRRQPVTLDLKAEPVKPGTDQAAAEQPAKPAVAPAVETAHPTGAASASGATSAPADAAAPKPTVGGGKDTDAGTDAVKAALVHLEEADCARRSEGTGAPGRPREEYLLNPRLLVARP